MPKITLGLVAASRSARNWFCSCMRDTSAAICAPAVGVLGLASWTNTELVSLSLSGCNSAICDARSESVLAPIDRPLPPPPPQAVSDKIAKKVAKPLKPTLLTLRKPFLSIKLKAINNPLVQIICICKFFGKRLGKESLTNFVSETYKFFLSIVVKR